MFQFVVRPFTCSGVTSDIFSDFDAQDVCGARLIETENNLMKMSQIVPAWGKILNGRRPFLSIEITKECPLRCPGCYAYEPEHAGSLGTLRNLSDLKGSELVDGVLATVQRLRPLHLSIVGGEPLVRYRELDLLLPRLAHIEVQLVTSAVRPIPLEWAQHRHLHVVVSIDGLQPEHDQRRAPATYKRILENIAGHSIIVHCTVTSHLMRRPGYLEEFARFWSARPEVRKIWFSLFTPQRGEFSVERLNPRDRGLAIRDLRSLAPLFPKAYVSDAILNGYSRPPQDPEHCVFAQITTCLTPDFKTQIVPCELGGTPECSECGCIASAGFAAIGRHRLGGLLPVGGIFRLSSAIGAARRRSRTREDSRFGLSLDPET